MSLLGIIGHEEMFALAGPRAIVHFYNASHYQGHFWNAAVTR
jgi:hypothetical protein